MPDIHDTPWLTRSIDHPAGTARCRCHHTDRLGCPACGPQPRERAVPCCYCARLNWNIKAVCDPCADSLDRMAADIDGAA